MVNHNIKNRVCLIYIGLFLLTCNVGCSAEIQFENPSPIPEILLVPYLTNTPTHVKDKNIQTEISPKESAFPTLTPTPFLYKIVQNDTLTSIAHRFGVKIDDLITANPGIDPNFLTIGISLTIPITGSININTLEPTPIPLKISSPNCLPDSNGGQWCLSVVVNTQSYDIENVSAQINLESPNLENSVSKEAITPINLLPTGKSAILASYFHPPTPDSFQPQIQLNSVIPVQKESQRYLALSINNTSITISNNHLQADISGEFSLSNENQVAQEVWVAAFAYDATGNPIGFRKWTMENPLTSGEMRHYQFTIYSLGPPINKIDTLYEARP